MASDRKKVIEFLNKATSSEEIILFYCQEQDFEFEKSSIFANLIKSDIQLSAFANQIFQKCYFYLLDTYKINRAFSKQNKLITHF